MAKTSKVHQQARLRKARATGSLKFQSRFYNRCGKCGRSRAYYRKYDLCRICLRKLALEGKIPGMTKSSW
ncbi:MAG: type Z 30S ribosomal protein S14 [bacterium]|nr:type Z 30S ribosomal protein S14 [bacterium]